MFDELGAAFTGQRVTDPANASAQWDSWMDRPGNRAALLQMGLQLMQPVAIGQTPMGHIGQAVGAGAEASTRQAAIDQKEALADAKIEQAEARTRIAQQNADTSERRAATAATKKTGRKVGGLTDMFMARENRMMNDRFERQLDADAKGIEKAIIDAKKDILNKGAVPEQYKQYEGMDRAGIREALRKTRPAPKGYQRPASDDDDDEESSGSVSSAAPSTSGASAAPTAPYPGARQAADGNWYVPDPKNPGKYLKVIP